VQAHPADHPFFGHAKVEKPCATREFTYAKSLVPQHNSLWLANAPSEKPCATTQFNVLVRQRNWAVCMHESACATTQFNVLVLQGNSWGGYVKVLGREHN